MYKDNPANMAEVIEVPYGVQTLVGPMNHELDVQIPMGRGTFRKTY